MALLSILAPDTTPTYITIPFILVTFLLISYAGSYLFSHTTLQSIPGPFPAKFSNLWLLLQSRQGKRFLSVDAAHKKHGTFVRIQPDHVSIADERAIPIVYGHGNGFLKAQYYDAFVSIQRGLFNTRDRAQHSRKRKIVSHTFSARSITQFEQYIHGNLSDLIQQWTKISRAAQAGSKTTYAQIDSLDWFNYLAFDIIGDLAFGTPFGMIKAGQDRAAVRSATDPDGKTSYAPAVQVLNRRGEVSNTLGSYPQLKPYAKYLPDPFFSKGLEAVSQLAGIAIAAVKTRLEAERKSGRKSERVDLLARLMEGKDDAGDPMGEAELTAEALTQLIAGSDTTSNTSCAFFYWVCKTPGVYAKLRAEIDEAMKDKSQDIIIPDYSAVKDLPYLQQCISEALRIHSTSSLGLPRLVTPASGVDVCGKHFPQGTVLSIPAYTIHHSRRIWGDDADEYVPDRWSKDRLTEQQKNSFIPFSTGPRACVGRNVAEMELALIISTIVRGFDLDLRQDVLKTREGFLRKPLGCLMGIRPRTWN